MGILATIYSLFLSSFHFNFDLKPRAETLLPFAARGSALWCHSDPTFVLVKDFPLPIIQTEQTMAFTQSRHDLCLRSCNSVKRRRWGQRSAITTTFFGEVVNHLPTVVALSIRSFMLANSIYLCFASANHQRLFLELET